jgi:pimeloyl-ACP methyl ester carboxylesterase
MGAEDWTDGTVDVDGVAIHFHRTGRSGRPPLVLAHGLSDNGRCWSRTVRALDDMFDVVMIDARNHGESDRAPGDITVQANDVAAVIISLGLDRPALIGHSMGASTVAMLAAERPDMVARVVLEDPPWRDEASGRLSNGQRDEIRSFLRSFAAMSNAEIVEVGRRQHPEWSESEYADWAVAKQQVGELAAGNLDAPDWPATVARIACPTLLVHGEVERGGIVSPDVARRAAELNHRLSTSRIHGAGHNIRRENFDDFITVVREFLRPDA